jgi:hypothetical protein
VKLEYLEEAYTTSNWIVRIYKVKPPKNRSWGFVPGESGQTYATLDKWEGLRRWDRLFWHLHRESAQTVLVRLTVAARSVISKLRMCYRDNLYLFFFLDWECHEGTLEVFVNFCVVIDLINMAIEILPVLGIK